MHHFLENQEYLKKAKASSDEIMKNLCHILREEYDITAAFDLIGSGETNLITQNDDGPIDLDYDVKVVRCKDFDDCQWLKECSKKALNKSLARYSLFTAGVPHSCVDSTSCLKIRSVPIKNSLCAKPSRTPHAVPLCGKPLPHFSIDVCITMEHKGDRYRLIHENTGQIDTDRYYWNLSRSFKEIDQKASFIKKHNQWGSVRVQYLRLKDRYVSDENHPSFVCYMEAVNNVYNEITMKRRKKCTQRK